VGKLIAIEGIDGSGKGTQAARLVDAIRDSGHSCRLFSFPRYSETRFGQKIGDFLNGRFGKLDEVHPILVSLLFAGDRFESKQVLIEALSSHDVVVCDRYVSSNIAHQAAKLPGDNQKELMEWVEFLEFTLYGLPQPDRTLFLDIPVEAATNLIAAKAQRIYTDQAADLHEADSVYLQKVHSVYSFLCRSNPQWTRIVGMDGTRLKSVDEIAKEIWQEFVSLSRNQIA